MIQLKQVEKRFPNGTLALENMSFTISDHEFVSFLGPSGCGKSTALRIIAGLTDVTGGDMSWVLPEKQQHNIDNHKPRNDRDISFVFQEPTLLPWTKVFDNVYLPLRLLGRSRKDATAEVLEALEMVGLSDFADVYPRELSGGMKMRVSIARALVTKPRLLLMDEPFAALDEMTRTKLNNDLLTIWKQQRFSVIFVTHSVYESVYLSDRIVVMAARPGRIIDDIKIAEPYPRSDGDYHVSERYNQHCIAVSRALHSSIDTDD